MATDRATELAKSPVFRDEPIPELEAIAVQLAASRGTLARLLIPATELLLGETIAGVPQPDPEDDFASEWNQLDQLEAEVSLAQERLTVVSGHSWYRRIPKAMQPYSAQLGRLQELWRAYSDLGQAAEKLTRLAPR